MSIHRSLQFASALIVGIALSPALASAQKVDSYSPADLAQLHGKLAAQKSPKNGIASIMLEKYPGHFTEIILRHHSGEAELHKQMADFFIVVDGHATLRTGGTIANPRDIGPGEVHGSSVEGGQETRLEKGSIIHLPANVPHQLMLDAGQTFTYFVIKVNEHETGSSNP